MIARASLLAAGLFASGLLTLAFNLLAARTLGPGGYGTFSAAFALCAVGGITFELGTSAWTAREVAARGPAGAGPAWRAGLRLKLALCALGLPLLVTCGWTLLNAALLCALLGAGTASLALSRHAFAAFRGLEETWLEALFSVLTRALLTGLGAALLWCWPAVLTAAVAYGAALLAGALAALLVAVRRYRLADGGPPLPLGAALRASIVPLAVAEAATSVYFRIDQVILQAFVAPVELGHYAAAYRLMEGMMVVSTALGAALLPGLSRAAPGTALRAVLLRGVALAALAAAALAAFGLVLGGPLLTLLFGPEYAEAAPIWRVLVLALCALTVNAPLTVALVATREERAFAACALFAAAVNVPLNFALVPRLGALGAAWATVATELSLGFSCALALTRPLANPAPRAAP